MPSCKIERSLLLLAFCSTAVLTQAETTVPNTFVDGTPAEASEVNENFDALAGAIDEAAVGRFVIKSAGKVMGFGMGTGFFISRQGYYSRINETTGKIYSRDVLFQTNDCSGPAYIGLGGQQPTTVYSGPAPGFVMFSGLSSYWAIPLTATLETVTVRSILSSFGSSGGVATCSESNPVTTVGPIVIPNDPAVTGIQNKGAKGGEEYAWPITYEMR